MSHEIAPMTWIRKDLIPEDVKRSSSVLVPSVEKLDVVRLTNMVKQFCRGDADRKIERGKKLQEVSCDPILSLPQQPGSES